MTSRKKRVLLIQIVIFIFASFLIYITYYDKKDAIDYIKNFGNVAFQKKQIEKGEKGWNAWPPTYDLTGDFIGQGPGSKIKRIKSLKDVKY